MAHFRPDSRDGEKKVESSGMSGCSGKTGLWQEASSQIGRKLKPVSEPHTVWHSGCNLNLKLLEMATFEDSWQNSITAYRHDVQRGQEEIWKRRNDRQLGGSLHMYTSATVEVVGLCAGAAWKDFLPVILRSIYLNCFTRQPGSLWCVFYPSVLGGKFSNSAGCSRCFWKLRRRFWKTPRTAGETSDSYFILNLRLITYKMTSSTNSPCSFH